MVVAWIVAGLVLLALELHNVAFYALFVAVGCFAAGLTAVLVPDAIAAQAIVAVAVSLGGILVLRPRVRAAMAPVPNPIMTVAPVLRPRCRRRRHRGARGGGGRRPATR